MSMKPGTTYRPSADSTRVARIPARVAHGSNPVVADGHVGFESVLPEAVHDQAVANQQVEVSTRGFIGAASHCEASRSIIMAGRALLILRKVDAHLIQ